MAILFELLEEIIQEDGSIVPQPPKQKNLLSVSTASTASTSQNKLPNAERKARRDALIVAHKDKHARVIAQELRRVGLEVGYYTNTETREYRTLSYSPNVRQRVLAGEVFPKDLRIELIRVIPGYTQPKPQALDGCTSPPDLKKRRKRSHSAVEGGETDATDAATTARPLGHPLLAERRPVGRPRKRPATGTIVVQATSSLPTIITPNATPQGSVSPKDTVEDQPCPTVRCYTSTDDDRNHSPGPPSPTCEESCPHPVTGKEQLALEHGGRVYPCGNRSKHDPQNEGVVKWICRQCVVAGHELIQTRRAHLLTPAFLPLCATCSQEAKVKNPSTTAFNGCKCPLQVPPEVPSGNTSQQNHLSYCLRCRVRWLEQTNIRLMAEEKVRRGIVGAGIVKGKTETIFLGRMCVCGQHLGGMPFSDDGMEGCAKRCAGCGGIWHAGTPAEDEVVTSEVAQ
ncbi:hypothetical protein MMC27_006581 [Xylographa pallens]|nr:hypothetical protein [Xylographa pallens]